MIPASAQGKATQIANLLKNHQVPMILTSINYSTLSEALVLLELHPGLCLSTEMLNTPDGIELICDEAGPERLVFGSGFPTTYFEGPKLAVETAQITERSRDAILGGNITKLLGLK
jgi:predicted TIM-barrel fold metal-dependent hydrolase